MDVALDYAEQQSSMYDDEGAVNRRRLRIVQKQALENNYLQTFSQRFDEAVHAKAMVWTSGPGQDDRLAWPSGWCVGTKRRAEDKTEERGFMVVTYLDRWIDYPLQEQFQELLLSRDDRLSEVVVTVEMTWRMLLCLKRCCRFRVYLKKFKAES